MTFNEAMEHMQKGNHAKYLGTEYYMHKDGTVWYKVPEISPTFGIQITTFTVKAIQSQEWEAL